MPQDKKLIPFGEISESFKGLKDEGIYYVDKTGFIPYLISQKRQICVFTRPRRFGKTLMLRTLQTFFEYALDDDGNPVDNRHYFEGLKVMEAGEDVLKHLGQYPVISVSFSDVKGETKEEIIASMTEALIQAYEPHKKLILGTTNGLMDKCLDDLNKQNGIGLAFFLESLMYQLYNSTRRKVVVLMDDYDMPIYRAYQQYSKTQNVELYEVITSLVSGIMSSVYKSNDCLSFGYINGTTSLNAQSIVNAGWINPISHIPDEYWGFTTEEVQNMLAYYGLEEQMDTLKYWYDGYYYSNREVYNPWSVLNAIYAILNDEGEDAFKAYWGLTSGNDIIDDMIERNPEHRTGLAKLMNGKILTVPLYENLSYRDLKENPEAIWSFLLYTGYLKSVLVNKNERNRLQAKIAIPNEEVRTLMDSSMERWWKNIRIAQFDAHNLMQAFCNGDTDDACRELRFVLNDSTSVFDYNEAFYHGMLVGLLKNVATVRSNDEYGEGRPDIVAVAQDKGIVLEVKCVTPKALAQAKKAHSDMDEEDIIDAQVYIQLNEAEKQIKGRKYVRAVLRDEPGAREAVAYAVCFCKKWCVVRAVSAV